MNVEAALKAAGISAGLVYGAAHTLKTAFFKMHYFKPSDFGVWWPFMDVSLLLNMEYFRERLPGAVGMPVVLLISKASGSVGRLTGSHTSMHFAGGGAVRAVDVMPAIQRPDGMLQALNRAQMGKAYKLAAKLFSGVGVYPEWKPFPGFHLDVRPDRAPGSPATWSRVAVDGKQQYMGVNVAWEPQRWA